MVRPKFVDKITKGRSVVEEIKTQVINPAICSRKTIDKVKLALEGVIENGTATNLKILTLKSQGKPVQRKSRMNLMGISMIQK